MTKKHSDYIPGIDKALIDEALEWRAVMDEDVVDGDKRAAFQAWVMSDPSHMQAFDYAERFWEQLKLVADPVDSQATGTSNVTAIGLSWNRRPITLIGSALVLVVAALGVKVALLEEPTSIDNEIPSITYKTETAEVRSIMLADGSRVVLGPGSGVEARIDDGRRAVSLLGGEAYFDVAEDLRRPFYVSAGTANISVIGTRFDVRTSNERVRIAVAEGRVEVGIADSEAVDRAQETIALNPGQAVTMDRGSMSEISAISRDLVGAWRDNRLAFFNEPMSDLVEQVNRYDRREIILADNELATLTISATLDASDIDALLQTLAEIYPVVITESEANQLVITAKK